MDGGLMRSSTLVNFRMRDELRWFGLKPLFRMHHRAALSACPANVDSHVIAISPSLNLELVHERL
jgi:hypothetical protein